MSDSGGQFPAEGRFLRIEQGIADINKFLADFRVENARELGDLRVRLVRLEGHQEENRHEDSQRVSDKSYWWMRVGVGAAIIIPIAASIARIIWG